MLQQRRQLHVAVGISGGVDSATAALLLKRQGHEVTGIFMRNWDSDDDDGNDNDNDSKSTMQAMSSTTGGSAAETLLISRSNTSTSACPVEEDLKDARKICRHLDIPLLEVDFTRRYWNEVFERFLRDVSLGVTPNPDVMCNQHIKFEALLNFALSPSVQADVLATGHYVRTSSNAATAAAATAGATAAFASPYPKNNNNHSRCLLMRAVDHDRDQSYFMSTVAHSSLSQCIFPLGELTKDEVRSIARDAGIHVAKKKSSVGICFIGKKKKFGDFVAQYLHRESNVLSPGEFIDVESGSVIGTHKGLIHYTYGQRARLSGYHAPWFVAGKDVLKNIVYLCCGEDHAALFCDSALIRNMQWVAREPPMELSDLGSEPMTCEYKARFLQPSRQCVVRRIQEQNSGSCSSYHQRSVETSIQNDMITTPTSIFEPSIYTRHTKELWLANDGNKYDLPHDGGHGLVIDFHEPSRAVSILY